FSYGRELKPVSLIHIRDSANSDTLSVCWNVRLRERLVLLLYTSQVQDMQYTHLPVRSIHPKAAIKRHCAQDQNQPRRANEIVPVQTSRMAGEQRRPPQVQRVHVLEP